MQTLSSLTAISPVDGRYRNSTAALADYFSEYALIRYRVQVEIEYLISLADLSLPQVGRFSEVQKTALRQIYMTFHLENAQTVKDIEAITNHDVKAVEYYLRDVFDQQGLSGWKEFIHFGLTSQDINNTALPLSLKHAVQNAFFPELNRLLDALKTRADTWKTIPMLARTHGQPASPTLLGKEILVFSERLEGQIRLLNQIPFCAKFGGATGNFNAHHAAWPHIDWPSFADHLIQDNLGLTRTQITTQIEPYDHLAAFCDGIKRINTILIDLARDMWAYISLNYFRQEIKAREVGSSTMPHKVNPIDFENAEGNLGVANAIFEHLSAKLPVSRLQRDLTDSTVTRNIGVPIAHTLIGLKSLLRGLNRLIVNEAAISGDLEKNWVVVAEGIQTVLRREGYPDPYEALKQLTRTHAEINREVIQSFIESLAVSETVKAELRQITPQTYVGVMAG
jgi:adenylosuccinate lyase